VTELERRYRLKDLTGGRTAEVWGSPPRAEGEPGLCALLRPYLDLPVPVLTQSLDQETGERGTRVVVLVPGSPGWLPACLKRAAQELRLQLREGG
jgi:hypothetical protein